MIMVSISMASSPPFSTTTQLNPHAKAWIPEAEKNPSTSSLDQGKKSVIMYPHDFFTTSSLTSPSPFLTISPAPTIIHSFQQLLSQQQPITIPPYILQEPSCHYFEVRYSNDEALKCYSWGCQPQVYQQALPLFPTTVLKDGVDEDVFKEKRNSCGEGDWKNSRRFVPPRQRIEYLGRKKALRQVWQPRKGKSDDQIISAGDGVVTSSPPPTQSPMENFPHCGNTTVMIKNIPKQYRRESLMNFLDLYCKNHNLEYDFLYLPMDFRTNDSLGYAFVNFTTPAAAMKIMDLLEGFKWNGNRLPQGPVYSKKICELAWAAIQGKDALVKHFQNSHFICDNLEYLPVVLSPPRNGLETTNMPVTVGQLKGISRAPRGLKK